MYTGLLKRIRKRDLTPVRGTFTWAQSATLHDAEIALGGGAGSIVDTLDIHGEAGDSLSFTVRLTLRDNRRRIIFRGPCVLVPGTLHDLYRLDESGPKMKPYPIADDCFDEEEC